MANIDFEEVLVNLKEEVTKLALTTFKSYKDEAKTDALKLVDEIKDNLQTWTIQLADGQLSKKDFEDLVLGQKEVIEINALKQAGLAMIKVDGFRDSLFGAIIKTVSGLI